IKPQLVDNEGNVLEGAADGNLCITDSWPGHIRTVYCDHERFIQTYFSTYKGKYFTGEVQHVVDAAGDPVISIRIAPAAVAG
ncbi:hypothetical protein ACC702_39515, partial [Rhizobium ruizarguesonis]